MGVSKKASEFVSKLTKKYPKSERDDLDLAVKQVEVTRKSKAELEADSKNSKSINDRLAADEEIIRREKNKEKRKSGKPEEKAPDYKGLREGYEIDKEYFAKGGIVTKSRSHPLNKFYGK
jgi:hypothetical protein